MTRLQVGQSSLTKQITVRSACGNAKSVPVISAREKEGRAFGIGVSALHGEQALGNSVHFAPSVMPAAPDELFAPLLEVPCPSLGVWWHLSYWVL